MWCFCTVCFQMIKQSDNRGILYSYIIPTSQSQDTSHHHRNHRRRHHRHHRNHHQNDNSPPYLTKADDLTIDIDNKDRDTNSRITYKKEPVKLDDKAALSLDQPQRDEQRDYEERYREYLDKLRKQQEEQRRLRTQQRQQQQQDARKERERQEEQRAQEIQRRQQEQEAELKRQEKLRDYARNTGFQAKGKQYDNVYRNFNKAAPSPGVAVGPSNSQQSPLPLQPPPTQYQQNRQIIPATNYGYPLPKTNGYNSGTAISPGSSPNRYPLLPNTYPGNVAGQRTYPLTAGTSNVATSNLGSYPFLGLRRL